MKTVFITGASSGLGRGLALHYAKEGAKVFAAARRRDELEKLARESENIVPIPLAAKRSPGDRPYRHCEQVEQGKALLG